MSDDVRHFTLGDDASPIDRVTLRLWKTWITWVRPILIASVLMMIVSVIVGTTIAKSGGIDNGYVGVWSPANYASAAVAAGGTEGTDVVVSETTGWTRGILAQFLSVVAATAVAWLVLRRTVRPAVVGAISGLIVVITHLSLSHQWSFQPVAGAPSSYQVVAVVALWLLPLITTGVGTVIRSSGPETDPLSLPASVRTPG
jgi:hypothetical protein